MKQLSANEVTHSDIVKLVSNKLGIDKRVVDAPCHHLFQFIAECIRTKEHTLPIRVRYWGIFAIRNKVEKK